jgi:hypothetical protein
MNMSKEEKNQYIAQYTNNIASQINDKYGIELINKDNIDSILSKFYNSPADLKNDIIPKINQWAQEIIEHYLEWKKQIEKAMKKQQESLNDTMNELNEKYRNSMLEELNNSINSGKSMEDIDKEISSVLIEANQKNGEQLSTMGSAETFNSNVLNTNLDSNNQGIYLSSSMTNALSLINCTNIEEINMWINAVPNIYMIFPNPVGDYSPEQIEAMKRQLFDLYQNSMISTDVINQIKGGNKEDAMQYILHKKLSGLNLSLEDELKLGNIGLSQGLPSLYGEVQKICIGKYGYEKGIMISNKIANYNAIDLENFNSSTYEQMQVLNNEIKSNIQQCNVSGDNFQLIIGSPSYENTVNAIGDGKFAFNYGTSEMGQLLAEKLGSSYRLKSLINRNTAKEMTLNGFTIDNKNQVIQILKNSLTSSLQSFNSNIKSNGKNKTFELFNELVETKKNDRDYKSVWGERFGITLEDMVRQVIVPNSNLIQALKSKNVNFMYNEVSLQESQEKRGKVMETMVKLQKLAPGLITVFGDQDHTFNSDYSKDKIEQLKEVAGFDKKMTETIFRKDEQKALISFTKESDFKVKLESTKKDSYIGKYTKINDIARKDNYRRINKDRTDFNNWKNFRNQVKQQKQSTPIQQSAQREKQKPFAQRSQSEIQVHNQIKQKNQAIKRHKNKQKQMNKPKVKTLTRKPNGSPTANKGFADVIILSLIVSFVCGALFMVVYMLIRG